MILARKKVIKIPSFSWFLPAKMPEFYVLTAQKYFPEFLGGTCPPSPTPMRLTVRTQKHLIRCADGSIWHFEFPKVVQAQTLGEVGILDTVFWRVSSGTILPSFVEIVSYLTENEQKNKLAQFFETRCICYSSSVRSAVCLSRRTHARVLYHIKTAEILSPSYSFIILVFRDQGMLHKFDGFTPNGGAEYTIVDIYAAVRLYLGNGDR